MDWRDIYGPKHRMPEVGSEAKAIFNVDFPGYKVQCMQFTENKESIDQQMLKIINA